MPNWREFARVLAVAGVILAALSCGSGKPQVLNLIDLNTAQRDVSGCEQVRPSDEWLGKVSEMPGRIETVPESVEDVHLLLTGDADFAIVRMLWKAENGFGGTSKRAISNSGKLDITDDCAFSLKEGRGWSAS